MEETSDILEPEQTTSNDSEEIQHQTESEVWVPRFETQLPSHNQGSSDSRISIVYQEPYNENESNIQSLITACDLPADIEQKIKALQTFDPTFNIFVSETGKISLKYDKSKTITTTQNMCRLIFGIPRTDFTSRVKEETFEKLARKQEDSNGCLIRYRGHDPEGPYYVQCWIHKCLIIILAYGDKSNTSCEALLTWIKSKGKQKTSKEVSPEGTKPLDTKNKNYKTVLYVESNEEEVKEIPRHVYKKMEARHIQSVCVPLKGSETRLIAQFVQYFSKRAKTIVRKRKMFLEMCISVESENDTAFGEARATLEEAVDPKMFECLKLPGFGLEYNSHDTLSPIEVELDTDSIEKVAEKVDVLVNSTNKNLNLIRGFVEWPIIKFGGKTIQEECKKEKKKGTFTYGEVCKTSAGLLHCRKIYHVALYEQWIPACKFSLEILAASVVQCLNEMEKDGYKSIAFPALGTGKLGYPYYPVARTMTNLIHAYGKKNPQTKIERVHFLLNEKKELCRFSFTRAANMHKTFLQSDADFIERPYKQLWLPKENQTVQIWPELAPSFTSGRNQVEAYFIFVHMDLNDSDHRRLNHFGGFVVIFRDWQETKVAIKDLVLRHGLSSVIVDIKDVQICDSYLVNIREWFKKIPCVELLKIVVNKDMFENINLKYAERFVHNVSHIDVYVWGNRCREVREELLNP